MGVNCEIGSINGYWENLGSYLPYTLQIPVILAVQYYFRGFVLRSNI
jgi:hypothetical protein